MTQPFGRTSQSPSLFVPPVSPPYSPPSSTTESVASPDMAPTSSKREVIELDDAATPSSSKRQKNEAVIATNFTTPGSKPDIRMKVFSKEYHVNSVMLKLKSAFFREFLDPLNGQQRSSAAFRYEWFTQIDDAGGWTLSCGREEPQFALSDFKGNSAVEETAFQNMLCAIFGREYQLPNGTALIRMTTLAEYYRCLPAIANSITGPIFTTPSFIPSISINPCALLDAAYKLRHKALFRECFIHVLGPASAPRFMKLEDKTLKLMAIRVHNKFQAKLLSVHQGLLQIHADSKRYGSVAKDMAGLASESTNNNGEVLLPIYFRKCFEMEPSKQACEEKLEEILGDILSSKLFLDKSIQSGTGKFKDSFLCFEPTTFPWDESETDW